jgi:Antidote-toxin recognition MazE, bacterial antitoxin
MKKYMKCECGGKLKLTEVETLPGINSEAYKCEKCNEVEFTEEQMREALRKKEKAIKIIVTRKLGEIGGSLVIRIPKSVENRMKLKAGKEVSVSVENNKIIIEPA